MRPAGPSSAPHGLRAVVMAGGEGTRLRPLTAGAPKPLLPVVNRPILEHVLRLLRRHCFDDTVVTVQFLANLVRNYFGDGEELGMHLDYATELTPLGTAGSVRNARSWLGQDTFLVISGDAVTDIDLSELLAAHRRTGALVTACLTRVSDPLEFGMVRLGEDGRLESLLEKPTWGQVISDTVNTGIYVMQPEIFQEIPAGEAVDWSRDVFPALLARGAPLYGHVATGYWQDVGTLQAYTRVHADVLHGRVDLGPDGVAGFQVAPSVWVGEGAEVDPGARLTGPVVIGDHTKVEAGAELRPLTVLGRNVVVRGGATLERAVVHDNAFLGAQVRLRGCVVGRGTDVMRAAQLAEGVVVGDGCTLEQEAFLSDGVHVYPFKTVEAGAVVRASVIWESRGSSTLFGAQGVSGLVNVEITAEFVVRLCSAFATTLRKGAAIVTARDGSRAARALKRAVIAALTASAIDVRDLEVTPFPIARFAIARGDAAGGVLLRTSANDPQSLDIVLLDEDGHDLPPARRRALERVLSRQDFRRAFPGEIAEVTFPARTVETYVQDLLRTVDVQGLADADLAIVVDTAGGTVAPALPVLLGRLGVDVLTVNGRLDEAVRSRPAAPDGRRDAARAAADLARLGELVASSGAAFGVRFDAVGERISLVDERGRPISDGRALLVLLDLVAAERRGGRIALPVTTTRIAEQVTGFHGTQVCWTTTHPDDLSRAAQAGDIAFAGDGRGGFVLPSFSGALDGIAAFVALLGLVARTRLTLSQIDDRIPRAHLVHRSVPTPWASRGAVMRAVLQQAGDRVIDLTDGVRVVEPDGAWALLLPDPAEPVTHIWAEGGSDVRAAGLAGHWTHVAGAAEPVPAGTEWGDEQPGT